MKIGDIVQVCDGSHSIALIKGVMQYADDNSLRSRTFRVHDTNGAYLTDRSTDVSGTNDALLVDVDNPDFVLFTQERFCRVVTLPHLSSPTRVLKVQVPPGTMEIRLLLQS